MSSLYLLDINPLLDISLVNIFSHSDFLLIVFCCTKTFKWSILHESVQFSQYIYWNDCLYLIVYSCLLCYIYNSVLSILFHLFKCLTVSKNKDSHFYINIKNKIKFAFINNTPLIPIRCLQTGVDRWTVETPGW